MAYYLNIYWRNLLKRHTYAIQDLEVSGNVKKVQM